MGGNHWEYALWRLLAAQRPEVLEIRHVNVQNRTSALERQEPHASFQPQAIVDSTGNPATEISCHGANYHKTWSSGDLSLYLRT